MTAACNFISLGEKMRELLDKNGKRKKKEEKRKITDHMIGEKGAKFACCFAVFFDKAGSKLQPARCAVNKGAQVLENFYSNHLWNMI